jgi:hypothetical protein
MEVVLRGVAAGVLGTLGMDLGNLLLSRTGILSKIELGMIGRMAVGWARGQFRYAHPEEMRKVEQEKLFGSVTHYAIGVGLAVPYVVGWHVFVGEPVSPQWAIAYCVATTLASWLIVYPSMGFGAFGRRSPGALKASLSPLANHLFFGLGMALGITLA